MSERRNCLVLGSGRSGTSMLAGTLASVGYYAGEDLYPPRASNPKGFFEAPEINAINEALIAPLVPRRPRGPLGFFFRSRPITNQLWLAHVPLDAHFEVPPDLRERIERQIEELKNEREKCIAHKEQTLESVFLHLKQRLHSCETGNEQGRSTQSPAFFWRMDEAVDGNATDLVGGHDATYTGATAGHVGVDGNAWHFDGAGDYLAVPHHGDFMLDEGAQTYFTTETLEYPLSAGVSPAGVLPALEQSSADFDVSIKMG